MNLCELLAVNPDTIESNLLKMLRGLVSLVVLWDLELSVVLQEYPQVHQQLVVSFETLVWDVHLLSVVVVDHAELLLHRFL